MLRDYMEEMQDPKQRAVSESVENKVRKASRTQHIAHGSASAGGLCRSRQGLHVDQLRLLRFRPAKEQRKIADTRMSGCRGCSTGVLETSGGWAGLCDRVVF